MHDSFRLKIQIARRIFVCALRQKNSNRKNEGDAMIDDAQPTRPLSFIPFNICNRFQLQLVILFSVCYATHSHSLQLQTDWSPWNWKWKVEVAGADSPLLLLLLLIGLVHQRRRRRAPSASAIGGTGTYYTIMTAQEGGQSGEAEAPWILSGGR